MFNIYDNLLIKEINRLIEAHLIESLKKIKIQNGGLLPKIDNTKKASLSKYGYKLSKSTLSRKRALKRAANSKGLLRVMRRVNLIRNYSKSVPQNYDKLGVDVEFLKKEYAKYKLKKIKRLIK